MGPSISVFTLLLLLLYCEARPHLKVLSTLKVHKLSSHFKRIPRFAITFPVRGTWAGMGKELFFGYRTLGQVPDTRRKEIAPEFPLGSQDIDPVPSLLVPLTAPWAVTP